MKTTPVSVEDLRGVFPVPPLARRPEAARSLDFEQNDRLVRHLAGGGMTRFLYGGNAFLYHLTLSEYEQLLDWLSSFDRDLWAIPGLGPSYRGLPGFTTGSGCLAPRLSARLFRACAGGDYERAEALRSKFLPLEDLRDAWGPARVLHFSAAAAGIAETGPVPPYLSTLSPAQSEEFTPVALALVGHDAHS